jgi:alpha-1,2-mannosyltransferase
MKDSLTRLPLARLTSIRPALARNLFLGLLVVVAAVVLIRTMNKAATPSRLGDYTRTAILRWKPQIESLDRGVNIYEAFNYPNPPIMALILRPIVSFPPTMTAALWFLLKVGMAVLMVVWSIRFVRGNGPPLPDAAIAIAIVLALQPILGDLSHGNVNIFIAAVVFAALELFRRSYDISCGVMLALAIACKVTPALFLPYFIWKRAWKAVLGTFLGLGLWLAIVPGEILGWDTNQTLLTSWFDRMVKPFLIEGKVTSEHPNQSIPGVVFRLFTSEPSFITYGEDGNGPPEGADFHTLVDLGTANAKWIVKGLTLGFGLLIVWLCWTRTHGPERNRSGLALSAEWSLILLGMLLLSERTWKHHAVTLILPLLVLAVSAVQSESRTLRWICGSSLGLAALLMFGQSALPEKGQDLALVYGVFTAAFLVLTFGIVCVLANQRRLISGT